MKVLGTAAGNFGGTLTTLGALLLWYRPDAARRKPPEEDVTTGGTQGQGPDITEQPLHDQIDQVLTEARVVLPGAQAQLGFQFVGVLSPGFEHLPRSSQIVHLVSLALLTVATILLMAPASYHRLVERGNASESFHRYGGRLLLLAMVPLLLGLCGDWYVVARHVTHSLPFAWHSAVALLASVTALWFGYPLLLRLRRGVNAPESRPAGRAPARPRPAA